MTSKSLLCNMCKEDVKRRLWVIAIAIVGFIFIQPVFLMMRLEQTKEQRENIINNYKQSMMECSRSVLGIENYALVALTMFLAVLCAISGFAYLQSKRKVDFYHSIPVKRETLFASSYIVGIAIYTIPYVVSLCVCMVLAKINNAFDIGVWNAAWRAFGINLLNYTIIFSVVVIAILLTGQIIVSMLASAVFFAYGPAVAAIYALLARDFFDTYYGQLNGFMNVLLNFSPIGAYVRMIGTGLRGTTKVSSVLLYMSASILLGTLALFIYKKRNSEAAGKAISYKKIKPIIKVMISIPVGLFVGMVFKEFTNNDSMAWRIFGMICGYVLCSVIMEIIYHFDFKAGFKSKTSFITGGVIMFAILAIFNYDLFHYDSYIPSESSIESMAVAMLDIDQDAEHYHVEDNNRHFRYYDTTDYADRFMYIKDIDVAYDLAKKVTKSYTQVNDRYEEGYNYNEYTTINMIYRLNSGRKVYRSYTVKIDEIYDDINKLYQMKEYKEGVFELYHIKQMDSVECSNEFQTVKMSLSKEECTQLRNVYLEELTALSLDDLKAEVPVAKLSVTSKKAEYTVKIYPSFKNTIEFLTEHGFDFNKTYNIDEIQSVNAEYSIPYEQRDNKEYTDYLAKNPKWGYYFNIEYKDKEKIKELLPYIVKEEYSWHNRFASNYDSDLTITITSSTDNYGNKDEQRYVIRQENIPEWLKKDIMYYDGEK